MCVKVSPKNDKLSSTGVSLHTVSPQILYGILSSIIVKPFPFYLGSDNLKSRSFRFPMKSQSERYELYLWYISLFHVLIIFREGRKLWLSHALTYVIAILFGILLQGGGGHLTLSRDQIINCYLVFRIWIHGEFIFETRCVRFAKILVEFLDTNIK